MKDLLKIKHAILLFLFIPLIGCKSKTDKIAEFIDGSYVLNKIEYRKKDITSNVIAAIFSFDTNSEFKFKPPIIANKVGKTDNYDWSLIESENKIKIKFDTNNEIFKEVFTISFRIDDSSKEIHLFLKSENTHVKATRVFLMENFDEVKRKFLLLN